MHKYTKGLLAVCAAGVLVVGAVTVPPLLETPAVAGAAGPALTPTITTTTAAVPAFSTITITVRTTVSAASGTPAAEVKSSAQAAEVKSSAQAAARAAASSRAAATATPTPSTARTPGTAATTTTAKSSVDLCGAPVNPYGFNYCGRGVEQSAPPADICTYFRCIPYFPHGKGHMEECRDTMLSMSGGRRGACSYHGGTLLAVTG